MLGYDWLQKNLTNVYGILNTLPLLVNVTSLGLIELLYFPIINYIIIELAL